MCREWVILYHSALTTLYQISLLKSLLPIRKRRQKGWKSQGCWITSWKQSSRQNVANTACTRPIQARQTLHWEGEMATKSHSLPRSYLHFIPSGRKKNLCSQIECHWYINNTLRADLIPYSLVVVSKWKIDFVYFEGFLLVCLRLLWILLLLFLCWF